MRHICYWLLFFCFPCLAAEPDPYQDWLTFKKEHALYATGPTGYYSIQDVIVLAPGETAHLPPAEPLADSRWVKDTKEGLVQVRYQDGKALVSGTGIESLDLLKDKDQQQSLPNGLIVGAKVHEDSLKTWLFNPELPTLRKFEGLSYFPYDPKGVVKGAFRKKPTPVGVNHLDSRNESGLMYWIGDVEVPIAGKAQRLRAFNYQKDWDKIDHLLLFFRDKTSGKNTYGGGRVIEIHFPKGTPPRDPTINLNKLYSFLCAHSEHFNCPVNLTDYVGTELNYGEKYPPL